MEYPEPPTQRGLTELRYGLEIKDPYRSLEDPQDVQTRDFVLRQNQLAYTYLYDYPLRSRLETHIRTDLSRPTCSAPQLQGDGNYYWLHSDANSTRQILVRSDDLSEGYGVSPALAGTKQVSGPRIIYDPSKEEGVSLYATTWSLDGRYICLVLQYNGSDWQIIRIMDSTTLLPIEPDLTGSKFTFGATWLDNDGVLYKRLINNHLPPSCSSEQSGVDGRFGLFYHRLGTRQEEDVLVWYGTSGQGQSLIMGHFRVTTMGSGGKGEGRRWLIVDTYKDTTPDAQVWMVEIPINLVELPTSILPHLVRTQSRWFSTGFQGMTTYVASSNDGRHFFTSNVGCPSGRIVYFTTADWDTSMPGQVIPMRELVSAHPEGHVLRTANLVNNQLLVLVYLQHACAKVVFECLTSTTATTSSDHSFAADFNTAQEVLEIPQYADISTVISRHDSPDFFLSIDTFTSPPYILHGHLTSEGPDIGTLDFTRLTMGPESKLPDNDDFITVQTFYPSSDGTQIPMFISHSRNTDLTRPSPLLIYGYGGFATPILPKYDPFFAAWMKHLGGVLAVPGIRGGGEYGESWHKAAVGVNRPVAFDDFAKAAEYLHGLGISNPSLTAAHGTSNGGLLVAATVQRYPHLFGIAFPDVALTDMCRYHLFTLGKLWLGEYGDPDDPDQIRHIHAYSPYHHVGPEQAAILVTTGENDTRVIPGHSLKYLAALQATRSDKSLPPVLGRIYEKAGHEGGNKNVEQKVEEAVDRLVFALRSMPLRS